MSEKQVTITVNGISLQAPAGAMLIEATDAANIHIPRFCYHKKLSVAANCRMCLVEMERSPKPVPACATPVWDGMNVWTKSEVALQAQKDTMEFLLINHPLDCPICDQGGECELQDLAVGYGDSLSQYSEMKRVVADKNIGSLIATEMTRCIHCTRCVRFGEEVAGMRELGATGRGEFMQIGTFIEKSVDSELSGNVIDLCPVGALTAKPSRFAGRPWEMMQRASIAPHDCVGSNLYLHTLRGQLMRAVPRENDAVNECWISDRDRFSYQAVLSPDRLKQPMIRQQGAWVETDWNTALHAVVEQLRSIASDEIGVLASAHTTTEELYLLQKLMRSVGVKHIDHRLRQTDFSDQAQAPLFPWLGAAIEDLEQQDAVLLIGSNLRKDQPMLNHRVRKAALKGATVMTINPCEIEFNYDVTQRACRPDHMVAVLASLAKAALIDSGKAVPENLKDLIAEIETSDDDKAMAKALADAESGIVLLGNLAVQHPDYANLRALAAALADATGVTFGYLPEAGNTVGAWLTGFVPHRQIGGEALAEDQQGMNASEMLSAGLSAYVLLDNEPDNDCDNPEQVQRAMKQAGFVVALTPFNSDRLRAYADVMLPIATFAETSGTYVNAEGRFQSFQGVVKPVGEARPAWKVLRVLGNYLELDGFAYMDSSEVLQEVQQHYQNAGAFSNAVSASHTLSAPQQVDGLQRIGEVLPYSGDSMLRYADALQATNDGQQEDARMHPDEIQAQGLADYDYVVVSQNETEVRLPLTADANIPRGCVWVPAGIDETTSLGGSYGAITISGSKV